MGCGLPGGIVIRGDRGCTCDPCASCRQRFSRCCRECAGCRGLSRRTPGYWELRSLFTMSYDSDVWGHASMWMFAVCDVLYHIDPFMIPDAWEYAHGLGCDGTEDTWPDSEVRELTGDSTVTAEDLLAFGAILHRYCEWIRRSEHYY